MARFSLMCNRRRRGHLIHFTIMFKIGIWCCTESIDHKMSCWIYRFKNDFTNNLSCTVLLLYRYARLHEPVLVNNRETSQQVIYMRRKYQCISHGTHGQIMAVVYHYRHITLIVFSWGSIAIFKEIIVPCLPAMQLDASNQIPASKFACNTDHVKTRRIWSVRG